jgi:macrolide-specific efflux system membrane fusion protein
MARPIVRKTAIPLAILLVVVLGFFLLQHVLVGGGSHRYLTAKAVRADLVRSVMTTGILQAKQRVDVGAQVSGQLKSIKVHLGERVKKGQLLAEIDAVLSENALRAAKANLASLEAQRRAVAASLAQAELVYRRQLAMIAQDATSRQELEAANAQLLVLRANLASFDAQISQARSQVDSAKANLEYTKIMAPMDGEVVAIVTQEGQTVVASQEAPVILKLANLDVMTVKAQLSEADVIRVHPGQTVYFTILGDSAHRHYSTLATIEPAPQEYPVQPGSKLAPGPVFYNALFDVANPERRLRIAMTAQVTVVLNVAKNAIAIPLSALGKRNQDGRYPVRILRQNGDIDTVVVAIGITDSVRVQVLDGIQEGDEVVIEDSAGSTG